MSKVYSTSFYAGKPAAAGSTTLFTVPADHIYVLRFISLNTSPLTADYRLSFTRSGVSIFLRYWTGPETPVVSHDDIRAVLVAGDVVAATNNSASVTPSLHVCGYDFAL